MTCTGTIYRLLSDDPKIVEKGERLLAIGEPNERGFVDCLVIVEKCRDDSSAVIELDGGIQPAGFVEIWNRRRVVSSELGEPLTQVSQNFLARIFKQITITSASDFYQVFHKPLQHAEFVPGKSRINYAGRIYTEDELTNLIDASLEFYLTAGRYDAAFCQGLAAFLKCDSVPVVHVLTVNSGSSANLIALTSLTSPKLGDLALHEDDEVIAVSAGFPTSIGPIVQNRLIPVFVDIDLGSYNVNAGQIEKALSPKTRAIMLAHSLGIPFNLDKVLEIAERHRLWVIEDNCDALGAEYQLSREYRLIKGKTVSGRAKTGTIGHIGTSSFYPAHQITMGEGGAVYSSDADLHRIALSYRDWGRDCWCEPGRDNTCTKRFGRQLGLLPKGYDHKYTYSHIGYNLKITDMQAAIGTAQLKKLDGFVHRRHANWLFLREGLRKYDRTLILPEHLPNSKPSPFGFAITVRDSAGFSRNEITAFLESKNIQTRPVFAGNMLRQPAFTESAIKLRINDGPVKLSRDLLEEDIRYLLNSDAAMEKTFWIGVYPGLNENHLRFTIDVIGEFIEHRVKERVLRSQEIVP